MFDILTTDNPVQQENIKKLFSQAPAPIAIYKGRELRYIFINDAYSKIFNYREILGKTLREAFPELEGQQYYEILEGVFDTGIPYHGNETPALVDVNNDGELTTRYYNLVYTPYKNDDGITDGVMAFGHDVTDQVLARRKMEESETRFRTLAENSPDIITRHGKDFRYLYMSPQIENYTGIKGSDYIGKSYREVGFPESLCRFFDEQLTYVFQTKTLHTVEYQTPDEAKVNIFSRMVPEFDENGEMQSVLIVSTNVSPVKKAEENLNFQKQLLETVTQNTSHGLFMMNEEHHCIYMNEAAERMTGYKVDEVQDKPLHDYIHHIHPDGSPFPVETCPIGNALAAQKRTQGEEVFIDKNGRFFAVAYTASPIMVDGKPAGTVIEVRDTTEDKAKAQKLQESEEEFRNFSNSIQNLAWIASGDGWIYWYNKRWYDYTGTSLEEMKGWGWEKVHHPDHIERVVAFVKEAWKKNEPFELTFPLRRRDGEYRWFLTRAVPITDAEGNIYRWIGTNTDINEQVEAQKALRQGEEQLRLLSDFMPQIVWSTNAQGYHDFYNRQWYEFTGLSYEETKDTGWSKLLHPDDYERAWKVWKHSLETGDEYGIEYKMRRADGEYRWLLARAKPFRNEEGEIVRWFGTCTDIHDQKTFYDTLERLVAERTKELQRSNEDLQQFAHVTSHDLKEPIRKIKTFISRLKSDHSDELPATALSFLSKIDTAADRMQTMISGILHYSSMNAAEQTKEKVDLNEVMLQVENDLDMVIQQKNARLQYDGLPAIEGSSILLYQLFLNLINNSLKFSNNIETPTINITSEIIHADAGYDNKDLTDYVRISIVDNGIGFNQEFADKIFKTFYRLHSKDTYEGTGLGLAFCKKIVERHGGTILAEGIEGKGAKFIITLPLVTSAEEAMNSYI